MSIDRRVSEVEKARNGLDANGEPMDTDLNMRGRPCLNDCKASITQQYSLVLLLITECCPDITEASNGSSVHHAMQKITRCST